MKNSFPYSMMFILLVMSLSSDQPSPPPKSYKLVLQWPMSFCNTKERLVDPCHQAYPLEFSIHGLWGFDVSGKFHRESSVSQQGANGKL
ncbi:hypothetical protein Acr_07g0001150 [Actinidia rufa]|uniref:Uncharacterized protein n=1 Tax=Actinidia rufa TaxID=165716 RepID=A0A7J0EU44_9ERIC|nr:hypothetical protein Acr_07g0001150 [Actinidia rufa]